MEKLVFDKSALKEEVEETSIDAVMPVLLGFGFVQRLASADDDAGSKKDLWNGYSVDRITEVLASILDAHDDLGDSDDKIWALSKKVLSIFLKLPVGQGLHSIEIFVQLYGVEAADNTDRAGDYGDVSAVLRLLMVNTSLSK